MPQQRITEIDPVADVPPTANKKHGPNKRDEWQESISSGTINNREGASRHKTNREHSRQEACAHGETDKNALAYWLSVFVHDSQRKIDRKRRSEGGHGHVADSAMNPEELGIESRGGSGHHHQRNIFWMDQIRRFP